MNISDRSLSLNSFLLVFAGVSLWWCSEFSTAAGKGPQGAKSDPIGFTEGLNADPFGLRFETHSRDRPPFHLLKQGVARTEVLVSVTNLSDQAYLNAWVDMNADGHWGGRGECIIPNGVISNGLNSFYVSVPSWAVTGRRKCRLRISDRMGVGFQAEASEGEVQDHLLTIRPPARGILRFNPAIQNVAGGIKGVQQIEAVDFDGDGDTDILVATRRDQSMVWFENIGNRKFSRHVIYSKFWGPIRFVIEDINRDGSLDVVLASAKAHTILWLENDGRQQFFTHEVDRVAAEVSQVDTLDMEGDGDWDLVSISPRYNQLYWYENDGAQGFVKHKIVSNIARVKRFKCVDLEQDGDVDIVMESSGRGGLVWYENDGQQVFSERIIPSTSSLRKVDIVDMDKDGDLDILGHDGITNGVTWWANDGQQNFTPNKITRGFGNMGFPICVDMDGDGDHDVLTVSTPHRRMVLYEQTSRNRFFEHLLIKVKKGIFAYTIADMDGDADMDIVFAKNDRLVWYEQAMPEIQVLNGDRLIESQEPGFEKFGVLEGGGGSSNLFRQSFTVLNTGLVDLDLAGIQIDQQEDNQNFHVHALGLPSQIGAGEKFIFGLEYYPASTREARVIIKLLNNASVYNSFSFNALGRPSDVSVDFGDAPPPYPTRAVNRGGAHYAVGPQLGAARDGEENGLASVIGEGDDRRGVDDEDGIAFGRVQVGGLGEEVFVEVKHAPAGACLDAWIDFNEDGSWGGVGERISAHSRVTNGTNLITFSVPAHTRPGAKYSRFRLSTEGGCGPSGFAADGEVEDHVLVIYPPERGLGSFAQKRILNVHSDSALGAAAVDLDQDGDMDFVLSLGEERSIVWLENNGELDFTRRLISDFTYGYRCIKVVDVDSDGDRDVLSVLPVADSIFWHENDGKEVFTTHGIVTNFNLPLYADLVDMDGDGDLDILTDGKQSLAWLVNNGRQEYHLTEVLNNPGRRVYRARVLDCDKDGDLDIRASLAEGGSVLLRNNGGDFIEEETLAKEDSPFVLFQHADIDGDWDLDIVFQLKDGRIGWRESIEEHRYKDWVIDSLSNRVSLLQPVDLDGDRDLDIVVVDSDYGTLLWYEQLPPKVEAFGEKELIAHGDEEPGQADKD